MKAQQLALKSVLRPSTLAEIRAHVRQKLEGYELRRKAREQHRLELQKQRGGGHGWNR